MVRVISQLNEESSELLRDWCRKQDLRATTKSSYVNGRVEKWYRLGSNLQSIRLGRAEIFKAPEPNDEAYNFLAALGNILLPTWNSILVCGGPTSINWHRDHGHFLGPAVMINLGEAVYAELPRDADITKAEGMTAHMRLLQDGEIVEIDTKMPHRSIQRSKERFNITFRTIKPEFLSVFGKT